MSLVVVHNASSLSTSRRSHGSALCTTAVRMCALHGYEKETGLQCAPVFQPPTEAVSVRVRIATML